MIDISEKVTKIEQIVHDHERIRNKQFIFSDEVKTIRVDVGLSNDANYSCRWLERNDDVGVIGIEANPYCHRSLVLGGSVNSYINCLYLLEEQICKFAGQISEVFYKQCLRGADLSDQEFRAASIRDKAHIGDDCYYITPLYSPVSVPGPENIKHLQGNNFRMAQVLKGVKDIRGKYILLCAAADDVGEGIVYQDFYSTPKDFGNSSLREEVIKDHPDKGAYEKLSMPSVSLDTILDYVNWDKYPFIECIKIDVEGKELDVLKSCKKYLEKVIFFKVEAFEQTDENLSTYGDDRQVIKFLRDNDFELFDKEPGDYKFVNKKYLGSMPDDVRMFSDSEYGQY